MFITVPTCREEVDRSGKPVTLFGVELNGRHYGLVRYSQVDALRIALKAERGDKPMPAFPPKRFGKMTPEMLEERRSMLAAWFEKLSENPFLLDSVAVLGFLAQLHPSAAKPAYDTVLELHVDRGAPLRVSARSADTVTTVVDKLIEACGMRPETAKYIGIFAGIRGTNGHAVLLRGLELFESATFALEDMREERTARHQNEPVLLFVRLRVADPVTVGFLASDAAAMALLYRQCLCDMERNWLKVKDEVVAELSEHKARQDHVAFVTAAAQLPSFGRIYLDGFKSNFPADDTAADVCIDRSHVIISVAGRDPPEVYPLKVTRLLTWKLKPSTFPIPASAPTSVPPSVEGSRRGSMAATDVASDIAHARAAQTAAGAAAILEKVANGMDGDSTGRHAGNGASAGGGEDSQAMQLLIDYMEPQTKKLRWVSFAGPRAELLGQCLHAVIREITFKKSAAPPPPVVRQKSSSKQIRVVTDSEGNRQVQTVEFFTDTVSDTSEARPTGEKQLGGLGPDGLRPRHELGLACSRAHYTGSGDVGAFTGVLAKPDQGEQRTSLFSALVWGSGSSSPRDDHVASGIFDFGIGDLDL